MNISLLKFDFSFKWWKRLYVGNLGFSPSLLALLFHVIFSLFISGLIYIRSLEVALLL